eukprot:1155743-Pelagomonas_calceolata.AAC.1
MARLVVTSLWAYLTEWAWGVNLKPYGSTRASILHGGGGRRGDTVKLEGGICRKCHKKHAAGKPKQAAVRSRLHIDAQIAAGVAAAAAAGVAAAAAAAAATPRERKSPARLYDEAAAEAAIGAVLRKKQPRHISTAEEDACYRAVRETCSPSQAVSHLLAYHHGGASTPANLRAGGSKLNGSVQENSFAVACAMQGADEGAAALKSCADFSDVPLS